ncbi:MAG: hypothetical protein GXW99_10830 [Clostridiales bacterium]|nr:hypothetical protein [Clostridiales bacterium]
MTLSTNISFKRNKKTKYPVKTTMNLAVREKTDNSLSRVLPLLVVLVIVVVLFVKFGVVDRFVALDQAQKTLADSQTKLTEMSNMTKDYDQIASQYHQYASDYLTDDQKQLVDRLDLMDMLKTRMNGLATLTNVSIVDNSVVVNFTSPSLKQISELRLALLQEIYVQDVTVYTASTGQTEATGAVTASMVINVALETSDTNPTTEVPAQ